MAEIIANYLQFYMERELTLSKLDEAGFSVMELFGRICQSQTGLSSIGSLCTNSLNSSHRGKLPSSRRTETAFNSNQLFSYLLNLPVIFSTFDTELILSCLMFNKGRSEVTAEEFRVMFGGRRQTPVEDLVPQLPKEERPVKERNTETMHHDTIQAMVSHNVVMTTNNEPKHSRKVSAYFPAA